MSAKMHYYFALLMKELQQFKHLLHEMSTR